MNISQYRPGSVATILAGMKYDIILGKLWTILQMVRIITDYGLDYPKQGPDNLLVGLGFAR